MSHPSPESTAPASVARAPSRLRSLLRTLGMGRLAYSVRNGWGREWRWRMQFGWRNAWRYTRGIQAMRRAAARLNPVQAGHAGGFACSFMTGHKYWYQTLFCAHSLARQVGPLKVTVYDDGTLRPQQLQALQRVLGGLTVVGPTQTAEHLDIHLPRHRFPLLRSLRDRMPMMRKLVDLRMGRPGWQLYLDSDMLFHARPEFLLDRSHTGLACYMQDRVDGYALPAIELERICGTRIPDMVNAGIVGLDNDRIDWARVEHWLQQFPPAALSPQLLEQTLTAMLLAEQQADAAPVDTYHILYHSHSVAPAKPALLHFIYHAKLRYFTTDWRDYLAIAGTHRHP